MTLDWAQAVEKYTHRFDAERGGYICPISGKVTRHCFTDHSRVGYDEGVPRIVTANACQYCHEDKRTPAQALHDLNEKRKLEDE